MVFNQVDKTRYKDHRYTSERFTKLPDNGISTFIVITQLEIDNCPIKRAIDFAHGFRQAFRYFESNGTYIFVFVVKNFHGISKNLLLIL